jgi:hypothetical protein
MTIPSIQLKTSGRIAPHDHLHQPIIVAHGGPAPTSNEHYISPAVVPVQILNPAPAAGAYSNMMYIPQYAQTYFGGTAGYSPATNCKGYFMSALFQPNNNCYAYGCNIAPNTFPQPGRKNGTDIWAVSAAAQPPGITGEIVKTAAEQDGLVYVGKSMADVLTYQKNHNPLNGHFVALMISPLGIDANWPGDYHWARCDNSSGACNSWSQKDGNDQVTNFDFAGSPITDPSKANWTVNQGPVPAPPMPNPSPVAPPVQVQSDNVATYNFHCFMFVPNSGVNIL